MSATRRPHRPNPRARVGQVPAIALPVTFEAGPGFVTAVISLDEKSTIGLKFESPEQMLTFSHGLMEHAVIAWPNNPYIQYYLQDEGDDSKT